MVSSTLVVAKKPTRNESSINPRIFSALGSQSRLDILVALEDGPLSFSELSRKVDIEGPVLAHHLRRLQSEKLVEKNVSPDPNSPAYRIYQVTPLAKRIMHSGKTEE